MTAKDLIDRHGFRPGTKEDFMSFAGAEPDAIFKYRDFELDPNSGCVGIYSESTGTYHFYLSIGRDDSIGKQIDINPLVAWTCAAAFDEWAQVAEDEVGDALLRSVEACTKERLLDLGFEEL